MSLLVRQSVGWSIGLLVHHAFAFWHSWSDLWPCIRLFFVTRWHSIFAAVFAATSVAQIKVILMSELIFILELEVRHPGV